MNEIKRCTWCGNEWSTFDMIEVDGVWLCTICADKIGLNAHND